MKISEIKCGDICRQIRVIEEELDEGEKKYLYMLLKAAVEYAKGYTGLSEEQLDEHEDITIAVLVLVSDMYDNRQNYVDKSNVNRVVETILDMHCINLLPSGEERH